MRSASRCAGAGASPRGRQERDQAKADGQASASHGRVVCSAETRLARHVDAPAAAERLEARAGPGAPSSWPSSRRPSTTTPKPRGSPSSESVNQPRGMKTTRNPVLAAPRPKRAPRARRSRTAASATVGVAVTAKSDATVADRIRERRAARRRPRRAESGRSRGGRNVTGRYDARAGRAGRLRRPQPRDRRAEAALVGRRRLAGTRSTQKASVSPRPLAVPDLELREPALAALRLAREHVARPATYARAPLRTP